MKKIVFLAFLGAGTQVCLAKEVVAAPEEKVPEAAEPSEVSVLEELNKLEAQKFTKETSELRAEIAKMKLEREVISERLALEKAKKDEAKVAAEVKFDEELERLKKESAIAQVLAEKAAADFKSAQTESALEVLKLQTEIDVIEAAEKRDSYADVDPVFLKKPLRDDGILVISDRRIQLNGVIMSKTADFVTSRIDYWNNRDSELPIFIVIDDSPGGSVMAGYRILKAMEASKAPIHVVVKSFAASMAACITTLAEESYAYPNAIILHHQISAQIMFMRLNLTEQKEFYEESEKWWVRLAKPVAEKMGITTDEFIEQMYAKSTSGDWSEFGDEAKKLKWVNHIVGGIVESSITQNPDVKKEEGSKKNASVEQVDENGNVFQYLDRLNPKDVYFLYNPDSYYRLR